MCSVGERPARAQPRFYYIACEIHAKLSPIQFQREVDKRNAIREIYSPISNFDCTSWQKSVKWFHRRNSNAATGYTKMDKVFAVYGRWQEYEEFYYHIIEVFATEDEAWENLGRIAEEYNTLYDWYDVREV